MLGKLFNKITIIRLIAYIVPQFIMIPLMFTEYGDIILLHFTGICGYLLGRYATLKESNEI